MKVSKKIVLHFPQKTIDKPIVSSLIRDTRWTLIFSRPLYHLARRAL